MKFNFDDYKGNYVMHCKTEEEAKDFCRVMHEAGRRWSSGHAYLSKTNFDTYDTRSCYNFNAGTVDTLKRCEEKGRTILEWSDMQKEFTKADLKDGMVGIARDGSKYIYLNERFMDENGRETLCFPYEINDDLTIQFEFGDGFDIVRICKSKAKILNEYFDDENLEIIWERLEPVEMTIAEIEEKLGVTGLKIVDGQA